eukprot:CAMPEP_0201572550 /NCGR_PEP_ID=MMETSP0190_2-20130828/15881_1 /ASSEMBLY_ACC=CAM_ASM_000263 /TAXON_ID=37353 /ORGANISM="Rosalina sp." /LENGTH=378 /DNA_ID=CAMNT_0047998451 /DNA_START=1225 /DNA_END=2358 /DNA_ORIENTATION=+
MPLYKDFKPPTTNEDGDGNDDEETEEKEEQCVIHKVAMDSQLSQGITGDIETNKSCIMPGKPLEPPKSVKALQSIENGVDVISCCYRLPKYQQHVCKLLPGTELPQPILDAMDFENMEKNPRFGKPRQFRRKDSHFNYNRGWDANIGYAEGKYKAKHNKNSQFELHYQPTRREYNQAHGNYYDAAANDTGNGSQGGGGGGAKWVPKNKNGGGDDGNNQDSYNKRGRGRRGRGGYNRQYNSGRNNSNNSGGGGGYNGGHSSYSRSYQNNQSRGGYGAGYQQPSQPAQPATYYQQQAPAHQQWYPQQGHGHTTHQQYYAQPAQGAYANYYGAAYQQPQGGQYYQQQQGGAYYQQPQQAGYNQQQNYQRANYNQNNNSRKW